MWSCIKMIDESYSCYTYLFRKWKNSPLLIFLETQIECHQYLTLCFTGHNNSFGEMHPVQSGILLLADQQWWCWACCGEFCSGNRVKHNASWFLFQQAEPSAVSLKPLLFWTFNMKLLVQKALIPNRHTLTQFTRYAVQWTWLLSKDSRIRRRCFAVLISPVVRRLVSKGGPSPGWMVCYAA